jgi:hypothetical protein
MRGFFVGQGGTACTANLAMPMDWGASPPQTPPGTPTIAQQVEAWILETLRRLHIHAMSCWGSPRHSFRHSGLH